jgi:hypothetical protein
MDLVRFMALMLAILVVAFYIYEDYQVSNFIVGIESPIYF